jgi:hypothetical protein
VLSLLGLAGSTAATIAGILKPVFVGLSVLLIGRAHYVLYVRRQGNLASTIVTWLTTCLVIGFWIWQWTRH